PSHRERNGRARLVPVDRTADAVLTFDVPPKHSAPLTRGSFFAAASFNRSNVDGASNLHARPPDSFQSADVAISPECNGAHKALLVPPLNSAAAHNDVISHQEEAMGPRATRFALVFWMALAVVVIILAIKPWAGARDSQSKSAAPIPARDIIYQPQHWKVF